MPDSLNGSRQPPQEESREGFIAIPEWSFLIPQRGQGTLLCSRPCYLDIFSLHITCIRIRSPQVIRAGLSLREILRGPNHDDKWRKDRSQRSAILNILFRCKLYIEKGLSLSSEFFPLYLYVYSMSVIKFRTCFDGQQPLLNASTFLYLTFYTRESNLLNTS